MDYHRREAASIVGLLLIAQAGLIGCGGGEDGPSPGPNPAALSAAKPASSGDGQSAAPGAALPQPIRIIVTRAGTPEAGVGVTWSAGGTGSIDPASGTTDGSGIASTAWTLGQEVGTQTAQAAVAGATGSPVSFTATATGGGLPSAATVLLRTAGGTRFDPASTTIAVGGTVTWTWNDGFHDVTSTGNPSFPSSGVPVSPPATHQATFSQPGVYNYICTVHAPNMSGTITVQ